jgi:hypothetical protein
MKQVEKAIVNHVKDGWRLAQVLIGLKKKLVYL